MSAILHWNLDQVWGYCGTSAQDLDHRRKLYLSGNIRDAIAGFPCHWAYVSGNSRLSCSMCVLASAGDLFNGAKLNHWTWAELALMEVVGGWDFQQGRWFASRSTQVLGDGQPTFHSKRPENSTICVKPSSKMILKLQANSPASNSYRSL